MPFYRCGGGNLKPLAIRVHADSGPASTNNQITAMVALPFYMVKIIALYAFRIYKNDGYITLTVEGYKESPEISDSGTLIEKKTARMEDFYRTNPLIIDLSDSKKYNFIKITISGTSLNYSQEGILKIYPTTSSYALDALNK